MPEGDYWEELDSTISEIIERRKRSILIMYYSSDMGRITQNDNDALYSEFRERDITPDDEKIELDIILQTYGGDPNASYMLAQAVRDFSDNVNILIPNYAYSAGTLFSFCADKILFGHLACLSPIDISYGSTTGTPTELLNVDYYTEFVKHCRQNLERALLELENEKEEFVERIMTTKIEETLLNELANQEGCLEIGKFFRERTLTGFYSRVLLNNYLLRKLPEKHREELANRITSTLLFECPSHDFQIDYHMAGEIKFPIDTIEMMNTDLYDRLKKIIGMLEQLELDNEICSYIGRNYQIPYFRLYRL